MSAETPVEILDLETIFGDLGTVGTFCDALDGFICDLRYLIAAADASAICTGRLKDVDTMAFEIKHRISVMQDGFNEFIDAASASQLRVTRQPK